MKKQNSDNYLIEGKFMVINGAFEENFFRSYVCADRKENNKKKLIFEKYSVINQLIKLYFYFDNLERFRYWKRQRI